MRAPTGHRRSSAVSVLCSSGDYAFLMFRLSSRLAALADFFIAASFTGPERKRSGWISPRLINGAVRRNDLASTLWTDAPSRRALFNVESERVVVSHFLGNVSGL